MPSPLAEPPPLLPAASVASNGDDLQLRKVEHRCNLYAHLLPFAQGLAPHQPDVRRGAQEIADKVQDIDDAVGTAARKVQEKQRELRSLTFKFLEQTMSLDEFYGSGDLLELPYGLLRCALDQHAISDPSRFAACVMRIIPPAAELFRPEDEHCDLRSRTERKTERKTFLNKCLMLINELLYQDRRVDAYQALVLWRSVMRSSTQRQQFGDLDCQMVDRLIQAVLDDECIPPDARDCSEQPFPDEYSKHMCSIKMEGLSWTLAPSRDLAPSRESDIRYWNLAGAARPLRTAYLEYVCSPADYSRETRSAPSVVSNPRFHKQALELLGDMQERAWSELRSKVFLTAGTVLPVESTDQIFADALEAEGIPSNPTTHREHQVPKQKRVTRVIKPELHCHRMDKSPKRAPDPYHFGLWEANPKADDSDASSKCENCHEDEWI